MWIVYRSHRRCAKSAIERGFASCAERKDIPHETTARIRPRKGPDDPIKDDLVKEDLVKDDLGKPRPEL